MALGRARIRVLPAGLGKGVQNWLGKVRLGKIVKTSTAIMYISVQLCQNAKYEI